MPERPSQALSRITGHVLWLIAALAIIVPSLALAQDSQEPDNWWRRYIRNEPAALAAASAVAQRSGHVLWLKVRDRTLELENASAYCSGDGERCDDGSLRCDDVNECRSYWLMRHDKNANAFILLVFSYGEDLTVLWVDDDTGQVTNINGEPHFSADGTHFAIVQIVDCCQYNGIQVWRSKGPFVLTEYHELNSDAGPRIYANFIRWLDNDSFLVAVLWGDETAGTTSLVRRAGGWLFERPAAEFAPPMVCQWNRAPVANTTGDLLPLTLDTGYVCVEDKLRTHVESRVKHCVFSAAASPCENIEIPRVR